MHKQLVCCMCSADQFTCVRARCFMLSCCDAMAPAPWSSASCSSHSLPLTAVVVMASSCPCCCMQKAEGSRSFGPPLFPPLFRPEGQGGSMGSNLRDEVFRESQLLNRAGEAQHILNMSDCMQLAGAPAQFWCHKYKRAMQRCDTCNGTPEEQQQQQQQQQIRMGGGWLSCPACCVPLYCSVQCRAKDEPHHAALCGHLTAAQQRYAPRSSSNNSSSTPAHAASPCHEWRVLHLLQPEPGPLGMACQAFAGSAGSEVPADSAAG
ncbi:hypothetical protein COO60DRAFT_427380 [Scenedesmus sp. NREL 46B-D3]|nr:hypothetical protein COO60DRAFT_427380 [Scenedesmus sp. NREL 46B-D3]